MLDSNWSRWILASLTTYFDSQKGDIPFFIEGYDRDPSTIESSNWVEFRITGPRFLEASKDLWIIDVFINILISVMMNDEDVHLESKIQGQFLAAFINSLPVNKYGTSLDDDQSVLGCFQLQTDAGQSIIVTQLGQIQPDIKMTQSMVEAHYRMILDL